MNVDPNVSRRTSAKQGQRVFSTAKPNRQANHPAPARQNPRPNPHEKRESPGLAFCRFQAPNSAAPKPRILPTQDPSFAWSLHTHNTPYRCHLVKRLPSPRRQTSCRYPSRHNLLLRRRLAANTSLSANRSPVLVSIWCLFHKSISQTPRRQRDKTIIQQAAPNELVTGDLL